MRVRLYATGRDGSDLRKERNNGLRRRARGHARGQSGGEVTRARGLLRLDGPSPRPHDTVTVEHGARLLLIHRDVTWHRLFGSLAAE
jgi:hypothetical protein